jgi:hypothetical protein
MHERGMYGYDLVANRPLRHTDSTLPETKGILLHPQ